MGITVDVAYKSLNKYTEILCGDKVELLQTADSNIMILADGMGSGVKANILSTLTSKILGTMFLNGATLEECVDTISETLPICQVRQVAYSTFSILQVYHNGDAYLVEYDNPGCIFIRDGKLMKIPKNVRVIQGKEINEYRFKVQKGDALILMSDGTIHAGVGELLNFGWLWQDIADYAVRQYPPVSYTHLGLLESLHGWLPDRSACFHQNPCSVHRRNRIQRRTLRRKRFLRPGPGRRTDHKPER